jgi:general secretion pathway protein G
MMAGRISMDAPEPESPPPDEARISPNAMLAVRGLVGCVVIVAVIGAFAGWFTAHYSAEFAEDKQQQARADIDLVLGALEAYCEANGKYPANLGALWVEDSRGFTYLSAKSPPKDPWNNGYLYAPPGPGETRPRVWTFGRDKREGGEGEAADVKSWEEKR